MRQVLVAHVGSEAAWHDVFGMADELGLAAVHMAPSALPRLAKLVQMLQVKTHLVKPRQKMSFFGNKLVGGRRQMSSVVFIDPDEAAVDSVLTLATGLRAITI